MKSTSKKTAASLVHRCRCTVRRSTTVARSGSSARRAAALHLVERDRAEQVRQPHVVVEPEAEELRGLQEARDAGVGLERARHRPDQIRPRLVQLLRGEALAPTRRHELLVDRRDRAIDVRGADAGADEQRPGRDVRVERARHVVRHALPLADAVAEPAADRVLPEHVVHQPVGVVGGIGARDGREAVGDVGLRLVHHRDHEALAARRGRDRGRATAERRRRRRHPPNTRRAVSDARRRRRRRRRRRSARSARSARPCSARSSIARQTLRRSSTVPLARRPYGCPSGYSSAISPSAARTPDCPRPAGWP